MRKLKYINGKHFYEKVDRTLDTDDYLPFSSWLKAFKIEDFENLSNFQKERFFRQYQVDAVLLGVNFEHPNNYGLKGLFG